MFAKTNTGLWKIISLTNTNTNEYRLWLNCSAKYDVMVMAWNQRGHNEFNDKLVLSVLTDTGTASYCDYNVKKRVRFIFNCTQNIK